MSTQRFEVLDTLTFEHRQYEPGETLVYRDTWNASTEPTPTGGGGQVLRLFEDPLGNRWRVREMGIGRPVAELVNPPFDFSSHIERGLLRPLDTPGV